MNSKYVIGIDPGANGGIAVMKDGALVEVVGMPTTPQDLLEFIHGYSDTDPCVCYLEKVGGMPGQGGMAMFNFGKGYGHLEMALLALRIPTVTVTPQKWQKFYQLGSGSKYTKTQWKNILKAKAQQLFPNVKITLKVADALLIAKYGSSLE